LSYFQKHFSPLPSSSQNPTSLFFYHCIRHFTTPAGTEFNGLKIQWVSF
jgi:hypothetical protein